MAIAQWFSAYKFRGGGGGGGGAKLQDPSSNGSVKQPSLRDESFSTTLDEYCIYSINLHILLSF